MNYFTVEVHSPVFNEICGLLLATVLIFIFLFHRIERDCHLENDVYRLSFIDIWKSLRRMSFDSEMAQGNPFG